MKHLLFPLALCITSTAALARQSAAPPSPELLARMCSEQGVMGYAFGQTGVPSSGRFDSFAGESVELAPEFAPFTRAQPRSTDWSDRLANVTYEFDLSEGDEGSEDLLVEAIAQSLLAGGWAPVEMTLDNTPIYLLNFAETTAFERRISTQSGETRLLIGLSANLGMLVLDCGREDLLRSSTEEAMGQLPPGTPRPVLAEIQLPPARSVEDCNDPAVVEQTRVAMADRRGEQLLADFNARQRHNGRLATWMMWKLSESGKISEERLLEISLEAMDQASPGGDRDALAEVAVGALPIMLEIDEAQQAGDASAVCRGVVALQGRLAELDLLLERAGRTTRAALEAEAARLGVSLD